MEEHKAGTDYWAGEGDNGRHHGEAVHDVEHSRGDRLIAEVSDDKRWDSVILYIAACV